MWGEVITNVHTFLKVQTFPIGSICFVKRLEVMYISCKAIFSQGVSN